jgi:hypothetical protein
VAVWEPVCGWSEKLWLPYKTSSDQASRNLTVALEADTLFFD